MPGLKDLGAGIFVTKFYFTESQSFVEYSPKYMKYNVLDIKLETKVMHLHKIRVEKISSFLPNMYAVPDF